MFAKIAFVNKKTQYAFCNYFKVGMQFYSISNNYNYNNSQKAWSKDPNVSHKRNYLLHKSEQTSQAIRSLCIFRATRVSHLDEWLTVGEELLAQKY